MTAGEKDPFDLVAAGPRRAEGAAADAGDAPGHASDHPATAALRDRFGDAVVRTRVAAGDQVVVFLDPTRNLEILSWLKSDPEHQFDLLVDVTAVDYGGGRPLHVVYQLWSIPLKNALRVKCELDPSDLRIRSVTSLWASANWLEREVYDLFGIVFEGHPDPRRILMPDNYAEGHPLRKDFPLRGRFSRAEQTRRALSQRVEDYYIPAELGAGGRPQVVGPDSQAEEDSGG